MCTFSLPTRLYNFRYQNIFFKGLSVGAKIILPARPSLLFERRDSSPLLDYARCFHRCRPFLRRHVRQLLNCSPIFLHFTTIISTNNNKQGGVFIFQSNKSFSHKLYNLSAPSNPSPPLLLYPRPLPPPCPPRHPSFL